MASLRIIAILAAICLVSQIAAWQDDPLCGTPRSGLDPEINIVGGKDAQRGEWPWQGLLYEENDAWCGAILLTPEWAVTTAFCIDLPKYPTIYSVVFGLHNLSDPNTGNEQIANISEIFMHPNFTHYQNDWNIALLKLAAPVTITDYVKTVCVPTMDMETEFGAGTLTTITGWGQTRETEYSTILQEAQIPIIDNDVCLNQFPIDFITENMICAGVPGSDPDTCAFDSGGPMMAKVDDKWYLSGLILSEYCGASPYYPGVFTRTTAFQDWLAPIFDGDDPETTAECTYDEFTCPEGWCTDYCSKCNGRLDGCIYGGDESYCDGQLELFDPYPFLKITNSSIIETVTVSAYSECAELCLASTMGCVAFDVEDDAGTITCFLSGSDAMVDDNFGDFGVMHFELEKMPLPFSTIQSRCGKLATPLWLPAYELPTPPTKTFSWTMEPPPIGYNPGIMFDVITVAAGDTDCSDAGKNNTVTFRSGHGSEPVFSETICLADVTGSFSYDGSSIVVEFDTIDMDVYGFVFDFTAVSECSTTFTNESGPFPANFSSPNYPADYADDNQCEIRIQAPDGHNVILTILDFQIEDGVDCEFDSFSVYNSATANADRLLGVYCGVSIPTYFVSTEQDLLIVFTSDDSVNYRGFMAQYNFVEDSSNCGVQRVDLNPETLIVGGKDAQAWEWPWHGLVYEDSTDDGVCAASLLTPQWAVTTGICIDLPKYPSIYNLAFGLHDLGNTTTGNEQFVGVSEIFMHPNYTYTENDWNIALLKLSKPAIMSDFVRTVCVPGADMASEFPPGTMGTITGWGERQNGQLSPILQEAQVPIVDQAECRSKFPADYISDNMICAGIPESGVDSCFADSGGPMVSQVDDRWYLSGIILSEFCSRYEGVPGVHTRTTAYEEWLAPIFEGKEPETIAECTYDEFTCPEGWCTDYCKKCNNDPDGCIYGGDESYCDGLLSLFDSFPFKKIKDSSVIEVVTVESYAACAERCLDSSSLCLAFDVMEEGGNMTCSLARSYFDVEENFGDFDITHFEIEKMPLPSSTLQRRCGKLASPLWLPAYTLPNPPVSLFTWTLEPPPSGYNPGIKFDFTLTQDEDTDCSNPAKTNTITFKSGPGSDPMWSETLCLNALPESVSYQGSSIVVEFETVDPDVYGFVLSFSAVSECSANLTTPGNITSPNYPENYPDVSLCELHIRAPAGHVVLLTFKDFMLEDAFACNFDSLSIYDSSGAEESKLFGSYCGDSIPTSFTSSGHDMLVLFKSDASVNDRGFSAEYIFIEAGSDCGLQRAGLDPETNIIGGKDSQAGEWPWQGLIYEDNNAWCAASLLTPQWAVTTGFCIDLPTYPSIYNVAFGLHDLDDPNTGNEQLLGVSEIFMHPNYTFFENDWNIALLKLSKPAVISDYVRTVCVPEADMSNEFSAGTLTTITGWGERQNGQYSTVLQEAEIPIVDQEVCRNPFPAGYITDNMMCAGLPGSGVDTCTFDSGGPMVVEVDDQWYLSGIILSEFCSRYEEFSGVHTRVTAFEDWLAPIFDGNDPETIAECTYDEFTCPEGWCTDYCKKCNSDLDGCIYGGDESYCDGLVALFDPFPFKKLSASSVIDTITVTSYAECAEKCIEAAFSCMSFDVMDEAGDFTCMLAAPNYGVDDVFGDFDIMHFELEKFPLPSQTLQRRCGKLASPLWLPAYTPPNPPVNVFTWTLEPPPSGYNPGIEFEFVRIAVGDTDCTDPDKTNTLTFRSGPGSDPMWSEILCLNELPESVSYVGASIVVEFDTVDPAIYGFVLNFSAVSECSANLTGPNPGNITSPNYPEEYPDVAMCELRVQAPAGFNVLLTFQDFIIEDSFECKFDSLSIYDSNVPDMERLMGRFCGDSIPEYFTSSGQDILVVFETDGSVTEKGFLALYSFVEENPCDQSFYAGPAAFTSPNYPLFYPSNSFCQTRMTVDQGNRVLILIRDFSTEPDFSQACSSNFDTLSLYDSNSPDDDALITRLCGTDLIETTYLSTGPNMLAVFKSDSSVNDRGFDAVFYSVPDTSGCDNVFLIAPNTISSPNYPDEYFPSASCSSLIVAPVGSIIRLMMLDFELEGPGFDECTFDSLSIYDSNVADETALIGSYCGRDIPDFFQSSNTSMLLVFESDASTHYRGFEALFEFITADESGCDNTFTKSPGEFNSPNYPQNYPASVECRTLFVAPSNQIVRITIEDFLLETDANPSCESGWDTLSIYDADTDDESALIGVFCGNTINVFFESTGSRMYVVFKSDSSVTRRGFQASFVFQNGPTIPIEPPPFGDTECGKQTAPLMPETNIVGGKPAQTGEYPWQAAVWIDDGTGLTLRCGAAILTADWVVTSAHCIDVLNDPTLYTISAGTNTIDPLSDNVQLKGVSEIYVHPGATRFGYDSDIALLNLDASFDLNEYVRTVCAAPSQWDYYFDEGVLCTATGWGETAELGLSSNELLEVVVPIYNQAACQAVYQDEAMITDNMICAGYTWGGSSACEGDEGGPLVSQANDQWYLVGVYSWSEGCARENRPSVFTRIAAYEDWIEPIYSGGVPDRKNSECSYDEFACSDGWCINYSQKCDGDVDGRGCFGGEDENFCEGDTLFFDTYDGIELTPSSIREITNANDVNECSQRCLDSTDIVCLAFDFTGESPNGQCSLANPSYSTRPSTDDTTMHFEIEKMTCPGETITSRTGRIATPKWLPGCTLKTAAGQYNWVLVPSLDEGEANSISITFNQIHNGDPSLDCSTPETNNGVVIRSGPDITSPVIATYCLNELPENVVVPSTRGRVEFFTVDDQQYGFLANFELIWTCDAVFTNAPGVFSTPDYPANYPSDIECKTMLIAPMNMQVLLYMRDFELESGGLNCQFDWDTMSVYDGPDQSSPLIGEYCGTDVPDYFRSSKESLYVVFKSDVAVSFKGFEAAYYHVPANETLPSGNATDACGVQTVTLEPEANIVGGKPAQEGEWPWQVVLYYFNSFRCGAALLTPEWIVTTASCLPTTSTQYYDITIGTNNVADISDNAQTFKVSEVIMHPQYDFSANRNDIALLHLANNATITDYVRTVCIPSADMDSEFPAGTMCTVSGWGTTSSSDGAGSDELLEASIPIVDDDLCQSLYSPEPVTDEMLCAGDLDNGRGICYGDYGGPLVSQYEDIWYLIGMPSWSRGCADNGYPGIYTRVTFFEDWIMDVIEGNYTEYECNQNFTSAPDTFSSPFYPSNYPNDAMCHTLITAPEGYYVYLSILDFFLEDDGSVDCDSGWDTLSIYDSDRMDAEKLLGVYCGVNIPRFIASTGRNMYVHFKSDGSRAEKGFEAAFYFVEASGCSSERTIAPGTVTSPNYPDDYPAEALCTTLITAPSRESVLLVPQNFELEFDAKENCGSNWDTLSIYDGDSDAAPLIGVYCGIFINETISSTNESIYMVFKSDKDTTANGYQIAYYFMPEPPPTTSPLPQPACGTQTAPLLPGINVVGGAVAQDGEWPWQVALLWNNIYLCGGALLTNEWVVTTAQCVQLESPGYSVVIGTNNLADWSSNYQSVSVSAVYIHPEYNEEFHNFDIALLKLVDPIDVTDYARTICAPTSTMEFGTGTECYATGWGGEESTQEMLNEAMFSVVSDGSCVDESLPDLTGSMICADGAEDSGVCEGDEGGPLVSKVGEKWYLVGLTSRADKCGKGPEVFTRMTAVYDWLAPIFDGQHPLTPSMADPLEPIRDELEKAREETNLYMYLMYTFIGIIGLVLLVTLCLAYEGSQKQQKLERKLAEAGEKDLPMTSQEQSGKSNEAFYDSVDEE